MQTIATDIARSVVCVTVCFGHTGEPCKTAELTEIPLGDRLAWALRTAY